MQHNVEENFNRFYKAVINQAIDVRREIEDELKEKKKILLEQKELEYLEDAYRKIQQHVAKLNKETNERISKAAMDYKKELLLRREEIVREVMDSVLAKIRDFINSPKYYDWLLKSCRNVLDMVSATNGTAILYVNRTDEKFIDNLRKDLNKIYINTVADINVYEPEDFIGGARAYNPETGIVADDTIKSRMDEAKNEFLKTSGLIVD